MKTLESSQDDNRNQRPAETELDDLESAEASLAGSVILKSHLQSGHLVASEYTMCQ